MILTFIAQWFILFQEYSAEIINYKKWRIINTKRGLLLKKFKQIFMLKECHR